MFGSFLARRLRAHPVPHRGDDARGADGPGYFFSQPGRGRAADPTLDIEPRADLRRVADPPAHLERHAGGRAGARHPPLGIACQHADRVMVERAAGRAGATRAIGARLAIGDRLVILRLQPIAPGLFRLGRQQVDVGKAAIAGEARCAFTDQEGVRRMLHHRACDRDGVNRILQRGDRADTAGIVHDHGVERHMPVAIRIAAIADRVVVRIGLGHLHARFHHVDQRAARATGGEGGVIGRRAEVPGRQDRRAWSGGLREDAARRRRQSRHDTRPVQECPPPILCPVHHPVMSRLRYCCSTPIVRPRWAERKRGIDRLRTNPIIRSLPTGVPAVLRASGGLYWLSAL